MTETPAPAKLSLLARLAQKAIDREEAKGSLPMEERQLWWLKVNTFLTLGVLVIVGRDHALDLLSFALAFA